MVKLSRKLLAAMLVAFTAAVLPSGLTHAADATPPAPALEYIMTIRADIDAPLSMGATPLGLRRMIPIKGGTVDGPRLKGTIMPGGEDWQLVRADGVTELDARYWLRTQDGAIIRVHNQLVSVPASGATKAYIRGTPTFEAPTGAYDWLNKSVFVSTLEVETTSQGPTVVLKFFRVLSEAATPAP